MANLYDSPAQAQFINTYVPIQFDRLYAIADRATEDKKETLNYIDDISSSRSLGSLSDAANKEWDSRYGSRISEVIDAAANDPSMLTSAKFQSDIRSLRRNISGDPAAKALIESRDAYKQTLAKADPKWGSYYVDKISSHNPAVDGIWAEEPMEYSDWNSIANTLTEDLGPSKIGMSKDGLTQIWGIPESDVVSSINLNRESILSDPGNIATADAQLSRLGIRPGEDVQIDEKGTTVPYNQYRDNYIIESVSAAAMDKTKKIEEKRDIGAELRLKHANEMAVVAYRENAKDSREAKKAANQVNTFTKEWASRAIASVTEHKVGKVASSIENLIKSEMANGKSAVEANNAARARFGDGPYNYWVSKKKVGWHDKAIMREEDNLSKAIASGNKEAETAARNSLNRISIEKNEELSKLDTHYSSALNMIDNEIKLAENGRSTIISKSELAAYNQYPVPAYMADSWAEINIGPGIDLYSMNNTKSSAFIPRSTASFRYASPVYGTTAPTGDPKKSALVQKVNSRLISNMSSGSVYYQPGSKSFIGSNGASLSGTLLVPESSLAEYGFTKEEIAILRTMPGGGVFNGKPIALNAAEITVTNDDGESTYEQNPLSKPVRMVKIPVASEFVGGQGSAPAEMIMDSKFEKDFKIGNVIPEPDELDY